MQLWYTTFTGKVRLERASAQRRRSWPRSPLPMEDDMANKELTCQITVRIYGQEKCFGPGVADLLERVDRLHSLRKATIEMDMAYSKAWRIIKIAEENLGFSLLDSVTGGKGGGGADLTPDAQRFLKSYRKFEKAVREYADEAFVEIMGG